MLSPLVVNQNRGQVGRSYSVPAPVGGLNARDSIAEMKPEDALILTNAFPEETSVSLRKGYASHRTGLTDAIETLMVYNGPTASKLLVANGGDVGDISVPGSGITPLVSSLASDRFQYTNFSNSAGNFLIAVNGEDSPQKYDGTTWATTSITGSGLTSSDFISVTAHKERLWFIEKETLNAWYLATQAISGAATKLPLGAVFNKGGYLIAMGAISADSGDGVDDFLAFLSSEGEIALYSGTDPSSASTWALIGVYVTGKPIGRRPLAKLGGDLLILTSDGVISAKKIMRLGREQSQYAEVSNKINKIINQAARDYGANFGWEITLYPTGKWLLLNVPQNENLLQIQYVMNIITGSWCKFEGLNANCWAVFDDDIYFGGNDGAVYKADTGTQDNGSNIESEIKTAFNYFKSRGTQKQFTMVRPIIQSSGEPSYLVGVDVDFEDNTPAGNLVSNPELGAAWDEHMWDVGTWGGAVNILKSWTSIYGIGMCAAVHMLATIDGQTCNILSFDILAEPGGVL